MKRNYGDDNAGAGKRDWEEDRMLKDEIVHRTLFKAYGRGCSDCTRKLLNMMGEGKVEGGAVGVCQGNGDGKGDREGEAWKVGRGRTVMEGRVGMEVKGRRGKQC